MDDQDLSFFTSPPSPRQLKSSHLIQIRLAVGSISSSFIIYKTDMQYLVNDSHGRFTEFKPDPYRRESPAD